MQLVEVKTTCGKIADSISDGITDVFHKAMGSTHSLTELSTRQLILEREQRRPMLRAGNVATFISWRLSTTSGSLNLLQASGPVKACKGIALPLPK